MSHQPAPHLSQPDLLDLASKKLEQLVDLYPQFRSVFFSDITTEPTKPVHTTLQSTLQRIHPVAELSEVVKTELHGLFEKLAQALTDPTLLEHSQMRLYVEQQLSDLLGLSICSEINSALLPVRQGTIEALPHSRRFEHDKLSQHSQVLEAGLSPYRYDLPLSKPSDDQSDIEQYAILYPCWLDSHYVTDPSAVLNSYSKQLLLLINPIQKRLILVKCMGNMPPSYRYTLAATPEVVRQGRFWWPGCTGHTLIFTVSEMVSTGLLYAESS